MTGTTRSKAARADPHLDRAPRRGRPGGALRGVGLEAPFVGRDRELRLIIGSLESTVSNRRAALVTVVGEAGLGKSRLLWEFFKYADGVDEEAWWHQGRCLSYGDGPRVLGAGRDGPGAGRHQRGGGSRSRRAGSCAR